MFIYRLVSPYPTPPGFTGKTLINYSAARSSWWRGQSATININIARPAPREETLDQNICLCWAKIMTRVIGVIHPQGIWKSVIGHVLLGGRFLFVFAPVDLMSARCPNLNYLCFEELSLRHFWKSLQYSCESFGLEIFWQNLVEGTLKWVE